MQERKTDMRTFWLNIGALDRDMDLSERIQILNALSNQGVQVRATFNYLNTVGRVFNKDIKVKFFELKRGVWKFLLPIKQQVFLLRNWDVDIVILRAWKVHETIPVFYFWRKMLKLERPKFVLDLRTLPVDLDRGFHKKFSWKRFHSAVSIAFKLFDGVTVISEPFKNYILSNYNTYGKKICVWSTGVDTNLFDPEKVENLRDQLNLKNRFVVMYHGIFSRNRGLQETIKAIHMIREEFPEVLFFLLGKGPAEMEFKKLIECWNLVNNIILHKPVPFRDVPKFLKLADVGILPFPALEEWNTSSPIKLGEYLAMGKPCVVTDIPAHKSVLGTAGFAYYVDKCNAEAIAETLKTVIRQKRILPQKGREARSYAILNLGWDKMAERLINYFQILLGR